MNFSVLTWAVLICIIITVVLASIETLYQSKASIRDCIGWTLFLYIGILAIGNSVATLLAFVTLDQKLPAQMDSWLPFVYAFFGIFAFEGVMSNTNVNFFDKGVLTIQDWIRKARDPAVASALERQVQRGQNLITQSADTLARLDEAKLNTYIAQFLGADVVQQIELDAQASNADVKLYKALTLASKAPKETVAIMKNLKKGGF